MFRTRRAILDHALRQQRWCVVASQPCLSNFAHGDVDAETDREHGVVHDQSHRQDGVRRWTFAFAKASASRHQLVVVEQQPRHCCPALRPIVSYSGGSIDLWQTREEKEERMRDDTKKRATNRHERGGDDTPFAPDCRRRRLRAVMAAVAEQ